MSEPIADPALRLREIDWSALEGLAPIVCDAAALVLRGQAAEKVLDRLLRDHREFTAAQRTAAAWALFGLSLWRRRLSAHLGAPWNDVTGSLDLSLRVPELLAVLLRDLAGLDEPRALALSGATRLSARGEARTPAERHSLPDWLWATLVRELPSPGDDEAARFAAAICVPGPIFLRANRLRVTRLGLRESLLQDGIESQLCEHAPDGLRVTTPRPNLLGSQASRGGLFEVQDEGSQLLGELLEAQAGERVLDLCAGAGGKSLQLAAAVGADGRVLCADVDPGRLGRLKQRAARAGATSTEIVEQLPKDLLVDRALVDAPCSELGPLRRGPDARFRIDPQSFDALPPLQLELLQRAARHVRPGGRLVYATCTLRRAENEEVVHAFERAQRGFARVRPCAQGLDARFFRDGLFSALPQRHGTDGFFAAAWERMTT